MRTQILLGDLLVKAGVVTPEGLDRALAEQAASGGRLGDVLVRQGALTEAVLVRALSKQTGVPRSALPLEAEPGALGKVPGHLARQWDLVPLQLLDEGRTLVVAMADPAEEVVAELSTLTGCGIAAQLAPASEIRHSIARLYGEVAPGSAPAPLPPLSQPVPAPAPPSNEIEGEEPELRSLRSGRRALAAIAVLALLLLASLLHSLFLQRGLDSSGQALEAHLKTIALQTQQVELLEVVSNRVDAFNKEFGATIGRLQLEDLELGVGALERNATLPEKAKRHVAELEKNLDEIRKMNSQLREFQAYLGAPASVKRGDTHAQLALDYLVETKGLARAQAEAVLKQTALAWDLEPGNQVFSFYRDGILLSTVTQGTASKSPLLAQWSQRRALQAKALEYEQKLRECEAKAAQPRP